LLFDEKKKGKIVKKTKEEKECWDGYVEQGR
jgi:hypothetical protein